MLGLFGLFGRAPEIQALDVAVRAVGLHPRLVPDAVKIATVKLLRAHGAMGAADTARAAELLAYCMIGPDELAAATDARLAQDVGARIDAAADDGEGVDPSLIMLTVQAGVMQPQVMERHGLRIDREDA
ncbi:MAG: hypothetical protein WCZ23_10070 [Rhodospirillaceae bacterium]